MKDYTTDAPVFSESISIVEKDDLVNFENKNAAPKQLLQNDLVLRTLIEALKQQLENNAQAARDYTDGAYQQSTGYTDQKIADLINGAPDTLDTLGEIAKAMTENEDVVTALHEAMGKKADQAVMESLLGQKLDTTGDAKGNTVTYTSSDITTPSGWMPFDLFKSGETFKAIMEKISIVGRNLRWMFKMLGTTDISAIGDGTVTGALSELNSNMGTLQPRFMQIQTISKEISSTQNNALYFNGIAIGTAGNRYYGYFLVWVTSSSTTADYDALYLVRAFEDEGRISEVISPQNGDKKSDVIFFSNAGNLCVHTNTPKNLRVCIMQI